MFLRNELIILITFTAIFSTIQFVVSNEENLQNDYPVQDNTQFLVIVSNLADSKYYCMGNLISSNHVLTTNSCASIDNRPVVTPVQHFIRGYNNKSSIMKNSRLVSRIIYSTSNSNFTQYSKLHNLAVLILQSPFQIDSNTLQPIKINSGILDSFKHCYTIRIIEKSIIKRSYTEAVTPLNTNNNTEETISVKSNITEGFVSTINDNIFEESTSSSNIITAGSTSMLANTTKDIILKFQNITEETVSMQSNISKDSTSTFQNITEESILIINNISEKSTSKLQNIIEETMSTLQSNISTQNTTENSNTIGSTTNENNISFDESTFKIFASILQKDIVNGSVYENITQDMSTLPNDVIVKIYPKVHNNFSDKFQKLTIVRKDKNQSADKLLTSKSNDSKFHTVSNPNNKTEQHTTHTTTKRKNKKITPRKPRTKKTTIQPSNKTLSTKTDIKPTPQLLLSLSDAKIDEYGICEKKKEFSIFETTIGDEDIHYVCGEKFCKRDLGGPLVCDDTLVGIMSSASNDCGSPYVYEDLKQVSAFLMCAHVNETCESFQCNKVCIEKTIQEYMIGEESQDFIKFFNTSFDVDIRHTSQKKTSTDNKTNIDLSQNDPASDIFNVIDLKGNKITTNKNGSFRPLSKFQDKDQNAGDDYYDSDDNYGGIRSSSLSHHDSNSILILNFFLISIQLAYFFI